MVESNRHRRGPLLAVGLTLLLATVPPCSSAAERDAATTPGARTQSSVQSRSDAARQQRSFYEAVAAAALAGGTATAIAMGVVPVTAMAVGGAIAVIYLSLP